MVFPELTTEEASAHLERLRRAIAATSFVVRSPERPRRKPAEPGPAADRTRVGVTVSIGVADSTRHATPAEVVRAADEALYRAKRAGRNRLAT